MSSSNSSGMLTMLSRYVFYDFVSSSAEFPSLIFCFYAVLIVIICEISLMMMRPVFAAFASNRVVLSCIWCYLPESR